MYLRLESRQMALEITEEEKTKINREFPIGKVLEGRVIKHWPFGVFLDIEHESFIGLIRIVDMGFKSPANSDMFPKIGSLVEGEILGCDFSNGQVVLKSDFGKRKIGN